MYGTVRARLAAGSSQSVRLAGTTFLMVQVDKLIEDAGDAKYREAVVGVGFAKRGGEGREKSGRREKNGGKMGGDPSERGKRKGADETSEREVEPKVRARTVIGSTDRRSGAEDSMGTSFGSLSAAWHPCATKSWPDYAERGLTVHSLSQKG